jgi:hypothetical protein
MAVKQTGQVSFVDAWCCHFVCRTGALRPALAVSDDLAADGFPLIHGLESVVTNLVG